MENTVLIQDRLFFIASAFFRVDNSEWLNEHELIYEEDEDEIVNRIASKFEVNFKKIISILLRVVGFIGSIGKNAGQLEADDNVLIMSEENKTEMKNYNGFYSRSRRNLMSGNDNDEGNGYKWFKELISRLIGAEDVAERPPLIRSRRMYRGTSLD